MYVHTHIYTSMHMPAPPIYFSRQVLEGAPDSAQYESENQRELRQIFDGQMNIRDTVRELSRKLDELLGRQELVLAKVSSLPSGGQVPQVQQQQVSVCGTTGFTWSLKVFESLGKMGCAFQGLESLWKLEWGL